VHNLRFTTAWANLLNQVTYFLGGGYVDGSSDNIRYNGSFNVQRSVAMGKPIVYRAHLINIAFTLKPICRYLPHSITV
jgi:hypothetical protein